MIMKTTLAAVAVLLSATAGQAQTPSLVLACEGKYDGQPVEKIGLVVNLSAGTVALDWMTARITRITDSNVEFSGNTQAHPAGLTLNMHLEGNIDRITGVVTAFTTTGGSRGLQSYDLICKPARRMF
jgi:hypothetical protein